MSLSYTFLNYNRKSQSISRFCQVCSYLEYTLYFNCITSSYGPLCSACIGVFVHHRVSTIIFKGLVMNSSSEKATVCISIDFCHQLRKTSGRIKWAILVPFHIGPLPEKPPVVFAPNEFEFGKGCPGFFRWIIPSRSDFKYDYVLILNPIFTSQFISDMRRRSFLTKSPDQLSYLVYLYFGKCHFLFPYEFKFVTGYQADRYFSRASVTTVLSVVPLALANKAASR